MKKIFPFLFTFLVLASCGKDDDGNNKNQLSSPTLLIPSNNASTFDYDAYFEWSEVLNATQYYLEISKNSSFSDILFNVTASSNKSILSFNDVQTGEYYWRVKALAPGFETSNFSEVFKFNFVNEPNSNCQFCQVVYTGIFNGSLTIAGNVDNFNNNGISVTYDLSVNDFYSSNYTLSTSSIVQIYNFNIIGELDGNVLTYTNQTWTTIAGDQIIVNGTATFNSNFTSVSGSLIFSGEGSGNMDFVASR